MVNWDDIKKIFDAYEVPAWIWYPMVWAESRGDPLAIGDAGCSVGLFQLNRCEGQGLGYSVSQLQNPLFNAQIAAGEIARAWYSVRNTVYDKPTQAMEVARQSGHPLGSILGALVQEFLDIGEEIGATLGFSDAPMSPTTTATPILTGGSGDWVGDLLDRAPLDLILIGGGVFIVVLVVISFVFQSGKEVVREVIQTKKEAGL